MTKKNEKKQPGETADNERESSVRELEKYECFFAFHAAEDDVHFFFPDDPGSVGGRDVVWVPENAVYTTLYNAFLARRKVTVWIGLPGHKYDGVWRGCVRRVKESS
ncbi:MAG: hypothetical protein GY950_36260 [bacterium]|nr:hypothetical protein [bacterium]